MTARTLRLVRVTVWLGLSDPRQPKLVPVQIDLSTDQSALIDEHGHNIHPTRGTGQEDPLNRASPNEVVSSNQNVDQHTKALSGWHILSPIKR